MSIRPWLGIVILSLLVAANACNKPAEEGPVDATETSSVPQDEATIGATETPNAPQDEAPEETENPQQLLAEATQKARGGDFEGAVVLLRKAYSLDPENEQIAMPLVSMLQGHGMQLAGSDRNAASPYFFEAAEVATKLVEDNQEMPARQRTSLATAIYNAACSHSVDEQFDQALKSLDQAFTAGFADFEQVAKDGDFDKLRQRDEFTKLVAKHYEAYQLRIVDDLKAEMEAHEPYDFAFQLPSTEGETVSTTDFKGKVLIADIWGTWCPPCRAEIPHFIRLRQEYGEQGLEIVGLNYERGGDDAAKIQKIKTFIEEQGMNYTCVIGDEATRKQVPNFRGYPTTVFIDPSGDVRLTLVGLQPYDKLEAIVKLLLVE